MKLLNTILWVGGLGFGVLGAASPSESSIPALGGRGRVQLSSPFKALGVADSDTYRLGDEWGKKVVDAATLDRATVAFRRAAMATARTGGATGFFLGEFEGKMVMATNHHVFPAAFNCLNQTIRFPILGVTGKCVQYLGTWKEIDLSLFVLGEISAGGREALLAVARNFDFRGSLSRGQELLTIGFGVANNPTRLLMANQDSDCKVFSGTNEFRKMGDPDELNPGTYEAWSFANGCDVSHGDSGSAMVDRVTGAVVGIIWTGRIPKSPAAQSSAQLAQWLANPGEALWKELSYSVPALKMGEVLTAAADHPQGPQQGPEWVALMRALLR